MHVGAQLIAERQPIHLVLVRELEHSGAPGRSSGAFHVNNWVRIGTQSAQQHRTNNERKPCHFKSSTDEAYHKLAQVLAMVHNHPKI